MAFAPCSIPKTIPGILKFFSTNATYTTKPFLVNSCLRMVPTSSGLDLRPISASVCGAFHPPSYSTYLSTQLYLSASIYDDPIQILLSTPPFWATQRTNNALQP